MLKSYLKIGLRNILKNKAISAINIFGLSVSMSVCLLIILIVNQQLQIDNFHEKSDRIYRVLSNDLDATGPFSVTASSPKIISDVLLSDYTYLENATKVRRPALNYEAKANFKYLRIKTLFVDEQFFNVFDFDLKEGNETTALTEPYAVVISNSTSQKFFGNTSPLEETIEFTGLGSFKITGVLKDSPNKSHLESDAYISLSTEQALINDRKWRKPINEWNDIWSGYNYLLVKESADLDALEKDINTLAKKNQTSEEDRSGYSFSLQKLDDINPGPLLGNELNFAFPAIVLYFLSFLAFIVLIAACFNYTNLSVARSLTRAREIGIRKVSGSNRSQIFFQLISESLIISIFSLILAIAIYKMLLPGFNSLWILNEIGIQYQENYNVFYLFFLFSLFTGILAGLIPALYMSKFTPIQALRDRILLTKTKFRKGWSLNFSLKKALLVSQFSLSLVFIITVVLLTKQTNFIINGDYGYDKENILNVELQGLDSDLLAAEFSKHPAVLGHSQSSHSPSTGVDWTNKFRKSLEDEALEMNCFAVDRRYIKNMDLSLVAGRNFPTDASKDNEQFLIINEKAVKSLGFENSQAAIGETLFRKDSSRLQIIGVVKNYVFQAFVEELGPMALRYMPKEFELLNLKLSTNDLQKTRSELEAIWRGIDENREFRARLLEEEMEVGYAVIQDLIGILKFISLLVITISCLGMLGMAAFNAQTRIKEIGIRKVLGANIVGLVFLISKSFVILLGIAIVIATPLAYYINSLWLNEMTNRVDLGAGIIISSVLTLLVLGVSAVASQTIGVALRNPVDSLRSE